MIRRATEEPRWVRWGLISATAVLFFCFLLLPLLVVFGQAFSRGIRAAWESLLDPDAQDAIRLTLIVAAISVPINSVCGVAAAWCIARFRFLGRDLLVTLIELPLSVSPVISGLVWVLLFGANGWFGPFLERHGVRIKGVSEEEAALTLGATGWQTFRLVTLPKIRWGLLYGVLLCNARAMGEFGAAAVVSGHVRGQTVTMPLHVEALFNDYDWVGAFTMAGLLAALALLTLAVKLILEWRIGLRGEALL